MSWEWLQYRFDDLVRPVHTMIQRHLTSAFRILLLGGDVLIVLGMWQFHEQLLQYWQYSAWLAGLSATLVALFLCMVASAALRGYHFLHDRWIAGIVGTMSLMSISCTVLMILER